MWWFIGGVICFMFLFTLALCKAAGDADKHSERIWQELQRQKKLKQGEQDAFNSQWYSGSDQHWSRRN